MPPAAVRDAAAAMLERARDAVPEARIARIHASSGTTGKPTVVGYTKRDLDTWAVRGDPAAVRAFYAALEKAAGQAVQMGTAKPSS